MKKSWLTWLGLGAACVVCCAPLIAPLLAGVMGASAAGAGFSLFGLGLTETLCLAAVVAATVFVGAFVLVRHRAAKQATACACAPEAAQCEIGGACAPSERGGAAP